MRQALKLMSLTRLAIYWDGGYAANPALDPLVFGGTGATDLIVVQLTPFVRGACESLSRA
jgi:predicted acylesterase/phospholipase RssA